MPKPLPLLVDTSPVCCPPIATSRQLTVDDATGLAVRLKAIADPARLQLVAYLLGSPGREGCTCDLALVVGLSEPTTSHHLKQLLSVGLVTKRREGINVYYRLVPEALAAISRVIDPDCC